MNWNIHNRWEGPLGYSYGGWGWGAVIEVLLGIALLGLLIAAIVAIISLLRQRSRAVVSNTVASSAPPMVDPALEAARLRYAKGEISADQLDEIKRNLSKP